MRDIVNKLKNLLPGSWFAEKERGLSTLLKRVIGRQLRSKSTIDENGSQKETLPSAQDTAREIFRPVVGSNEQYSFEPINDQVSFEADIVAWLSNGSSRKEIHHRRKVLTGTWSYCGDRRGKTEMPFL